MSFLADIMYITGKTVEWVDPLSLGPPAATTLSSGMIPTQQMDWESSMANFFDLDLADIDMKRRKSAPAAQNMPTSQPSRPDSPAQNVWHSAGNAGIPDINVLEAETLQRHGRSLPKVIIKG